MGLKTTSSFRGGSPTSRTKKEATDMDKLHENAETGCCPRFDPELWDVREITLEDRLFVKDRA